MTAEKIGIRNHAMLHDFETAHQRLTRLGIEPHQARRMALFASLRLTKAFNTSQAWEAVDQILGPYATQPPSS